MVENGHKKPGRTWRIVLVLSLGLNLLVIGFVVGLALTGPERKSGPRGLDLGPGPLAQALSPQERRAVLLDLRASGGFQRGQMREYMQDLLNALRATPFDPDVLSEVMTAQRQKLNQMQDAAQSALFAQINAMSPERRAAFADAVAADMSRGKPRDVDRPD